MSLRLPVSVPCAAVLGLASPCRAQVVASDWNTGSGQWHLQENWAPAEVPDNAGGRTYMVQIGDRAVALGAQVNLVALSGGGVSITGLTLTGLGTSLSTNGFLLSVSGQTAVDGASILTVKPAGGPVGLDTGTLLLAGQGTLDLVNGRAAVKGRTTIGPGTQLTGEGLLLCGNTDGQVEKALDNTGRIVCVSHSPAGGFLTLRATGLDTLDLDGGNETGTVEVANTAAPGQSDSLILTVDGPLSDAFNGKLIVGQRDIMEFTKDFALSGADITLTGGEEVARLHGPGKITSVTATAFRVNGRGEVGNALTFSGAGNKVVLGAESALDLRGAVTLNGNTLLVQGGGRVDFSGGLTVPVASGLLTTGTVSLDGVSETTAAAVNVSGSFSIQAGALDAFGKPGFKGLDVMTIDHRDGGGEGVLTVLLPDPMDTWRVAPDGVLRLWGNVAGSPVLTGAGVRVEGTVEVISRPRVDAQIIVPADGTIEIQDPVGALRLAGGAGMGPVVSDSQLSILKYTNRVEGGTIKGSGTTPLIIEGARALTGFGRVEATVDARNATVLADGGTLTLAHPAVPFTGVGLLGAAGPGSVLEIPAAWSTATVTNLWLGGGELRGGTISLVLPSMFTGYGRISAPLHLSNGTLTATGGTLVVDSLTGNSVNGRLRAQQGVLELRGTGARSMVLQIFVLDGGTVVLKGMAMTMLTGSSTQFRGGILRATQPLTLTGTVACGILSTSPESALIMEGDALLDFGNVNLVLSGRLPVTARRAVLRAATVSSSTEGTLAFESGSGVTAEPGLVLHCMVENGGRMELGTLQDTGRVTFGAFTQKAGGVLRLPLCPPGDVNCGLTVESVARLAGTLELSLAAGYVPHEGDRLDVLFSDTGIFGKFGRIVQPPGMPPGLMFVPDVTLFPDVLHLTATATTPYELWRKSYAGLTDPESFAKGADPDGDGLPNIGEFALHGDPSAGGDTLLHPRVITVNGAPLFTCTLPVRAGAVPDPGNSTPGPLLLHQPADSLHYSLQGSADLLTWNTAVTELTGADAIAIQAELPVLDNEWEYRTFAVAGEGKRYLRAVVME